MAARTKDTRSISPKAKYARVALPMLFNAVPAPTASCRYRAATPP